MDSAISTSSTFLFRSNTPEIPELKIDSKLLLGSSDAADCQIESAGSQHLMVRRMERVVTIMDLGAGKTSLNGKELSARRMYILQEGDVISLGEVEFTFAIEREASNELTQTDVSDVPEDSAEETTDVSQMPQEIQDMLAQSATAGDGEVDEDKTPAEIKEMAPISELKEKSIDEELSSLAQKLLPYCFKLDQVTFDVDDGMVFDEEGDLFELTFAISYSKAEVDSKKDKVTLSWKEVLPIAGLETGLGKLFSFLYKGHLQEQSPLDFELKRLVDQYQMNDKESKEESSESLSDMIAASKEQAEHLAPEEEVVVEEREATQEVQVEEHAEEEIQRSLLGPMSRIFSFVIDASIALAMLSFIFPFVRSDEVVSHYSGELYSFLTLFFDGFNVISADTFKLFLLIYLCFAFHTLLFTFLLGQTLGQTFSLPTTSRGDKGIILRGKAIFRQLLSLTIVFSVFDLLLFVKRPTLKESLSRAELCASSKSGGIILFVFTFLFLALPFYQLGVVYPNLPELSVAIKHKQVRSSGEVFTNVPGTPLKVAKASLNEQFVVPRGKSGEYLLIDKERGRPLIFSIGRPFLINQLLSETLIDDPFFLFRYPELSKQIFSGAKKFSIIHEMELQGAITSSFTLSTSTLFNPETIRGVLPFLLPYQNFKKRVLEFAGISKPESAKFVTIAGNKFFTIVDKRKAIYLPISVAGNVITVRSVRGRLSNSHLAFVEDRFFRFLRMKSKIEASASFVPFLEKVDELSDDGKLQFYDYLVGVKSSVAAFDKYSEYINSNIDKFIERNKLEVEQVVEELPEAAIETESQL